jgi:hypothetical protein
VRTCLLEVDEAKIESPNAVITNKLIVAAISGLVLSQLLVFLSLYWTPLQVFWTKPQMWTFLIWPYFVFSLSRVKIFSISRLFKGDNSIYNSQVWITFINGLLFQLLNPILLSNPILTRLMSVFFFRYSSKLWFITGGILGWIGGQTLFVYLNWYLLFRLRHDTSYYPLKRKIHKVCYFTLLIMFLFSLNYISVSSVLSPNNINKAKKTKNISGAKETLSLSKVFSLWPQSLFCRDAYTRPIYAVLQSKQIHLIRKSKLIKIKDKIKSNEIDKNKRFSEHLFDKCVTNGKHKLSYMFPQNLIIFSTYFSNVFETLDFSEPLKSNVYQNWVYSKSIRKTNLKNIFKNRIKTLDKQNSIDIVLDQKTRSKDYAENFIENTLDLRLNSNKRGYQLCLFGNEDNKMVVDKDVDKDVDTLDSVESVFYPLIEIPL